MAKKTRIPKKVAGIKVPKAFRRSKMLQHLLANPVGRKILADALIAGAGAAATTLVAERKHVAGAAGATADAAKGAAKGGKRAASLLAEAIENAADAVFHVVADAARSLAPEDKGDGARRDRDDRDVPPDLGDVRH